MKFLEQIAEIKERIDRAGIGLKDTLSLIDIAFEGRAEWIGALSPPPCNINTKLSTITERSNPRWLLGGGRYRSVNSLKPIPWLNSAIKANPP